MGALRRVADNRAGPQALGFLVPPGRRTVLILRPRALTWDLLLLDPRASSGGVLFREADRDTASRWARGVHRALEEWARGGPGRVEAVPAGEVHWVRAVVGEFALLVCPRVPGQPYRPAEFADDEARDAAAALAAVLCPPPGVEQEIYFNTQNFLH